MHEDGQIKTISGGQSSDIGPYALNHWHQMEILINADPYGSYSVWLNGKLVVDENPLAEAVLSVERLSLRTGVYRNVPNRHTPNQDPAPPLEDCDHPVPTANYIDDVIIQNEN